MESRQDIESTTYLLVATQIKLRRGQNVRDGAKSVEQHGGKLNDQDQGEEEHKHQTDGFQLQIFLGDDNLEGDTGRGLQKWGYIS